MDNLKDLLIKALGSSKSKSYGRIIKYNPALNNLVEDYISTSHNPSMSITQAAYNIIVAEPVAKTCGNYPLFNTYDKGYRDFCGPKQSCPCASAEQSKKLTLIHASKTSKQKDDIVNKMKVTMLKRHGVDNAGKLPTRSKRK